MKGFRSELEVLAGREARRCGVTRIADLTGLDSLGVPVWQATRPLGLSLSVHQGKGLTHSRARIGALMEAVEHSYAERWTGDGGVVPWEHLEPAHRSARADDFATCREAIQPDTPLKWTMAEPLGDHPPFAVPVDAVSLDFTYVADAAIDRSSNGLAAGISEDAATRHALHELLERDAKAHWRERRQVGASAWRIDVDSVDYEWFRRLVTLFAEKRLMIRLYRLPVAVGIRSVLCELLDPRPTEAAHAAAGGAHAHEDPEIALQGAVLEALQSRATMIAGAREDLPLHPPEWKGYAPLGLGFPGSFPSSEKPWQKSASWPGSDRACVAELVEMLRGTGFPQIGRVKVSPEESHVVVVKVFVPGLGARRRNRARRAS